MITSKLSNGRYEIHVKMHRENISLRKGFDYYGNGYLKLSHDNMINLFIKFDDIQDKHFKGEFDSKSIESFELILIGDHNKGKLVAKFFDDIDCKHLLGTMMGRNSKNELEVSFIDIIIGEYSNLQIH